MVCFIVSMRSVCCSSFFFFKQKTAYEMRISDWSSDVCSSDLFNAQCHVVEQLLVQTLLDVTAGHELAFFTAEWRVVDLEGHGNGWLVDGQRLQDRKSVV